jgi:serine/threonine protein phosphatase PrpC
VVSELAREELLKDFLRHGDRVSDTQKAFKESFIKTQEKIKNDSTKGSKDCDYSVSGSTCTMVYHDLAKRVLTVAHVGDSRSVLFKSDSKNTCLDLTVDHKPDNPEEKKRIEAAGGRVIFDGYYNHRVFSKKGMYPGLNMSRALGDLLAHEEAGLSASPDCRQVDLGKTGDDKYLLICTDGVWEFIESEKSYAIMMGKQDSPDANKLAKESFDRWMKDSDDEISDDITAMIIDLSKFGS